MKAKHRQAFNKLRKAGIEAIEPLDNAHEVFILDCETGSIETKMALDYYSNFWGSEFLNKTLKSVGLYFEWENPARAKVWEDRV